MTGSCRTYLYDSVGWYYSISDAEFTKLSPYGAVC